MKLRASHITQPLSKTSGKLTAVSDTGDNSYGLKWFQHLQMSEAHKFICNFRTNNSWQGASVDHTRLFSCLKT